ncbi:MAG TPA: hypothetical protein VGL22_18390 [Terracidiphilus sp.]
MGIEHELPSLVALVAVQAPFCDPRAVLFCDLLDGGDSGYMVVGIGIAGDGYGEAASGKQKFIGRCLNDREICGEVTCGAVVCAAASTVILATNAAARYCAIRAFNLPPSCEGHRINS